jgi:hypothetical protein
VPRSAELEAAERDLGLALVALVAGTRPPVSPAMVRDYLATFFGITDALVRRHDPEDFVVRFSRPEDVETVLHSRVPGAPFRLIWHPWRRTSLASVGGDAPCSPARSVGCCGAGHPGKGVRPNCACSANGDPGE